MTDSNLKKQKEVEFYAAGAAAWYNSRLEHDKSLLTLSAGGIGFLIALITTMGIFSLLELVINLLAMISFLACLISVLLIFRKNTKHIEDVLVTDAEINDPMLEKLDTIAMTSFASGMVLSLAIGVFAAINSYSKMENAMANENKKKTSFVVGDSVNGCSSLKKSFNGASALKPAASQSQTAASGASQVTKPVANQNSSKK